MPKRTSTIKHVVLIPNATPLEVFRALTSSKIHSEVTGAKAKVSAKVGARFAAWDKYITGKNLKIVKGKKLIQEWRTTDWQDKSTPSSILEISLKPTTKGTKLTLMQSKVPSKEMARDYDKGWHTAYWNPMKTYFKNKKKAKS